MKRRGVPLLPHMHTTSRTELRCTDSGTHTVAAVASVRRAYMQLGAHVPGSLFMRRQLRLRVLIVKHANVGLLDGIRLL